MFSKEKANWEQFFDFYKKKFDENVSVLPSFFENDEFDIDFLAGENSGKIRGLRLIQIDPYNDDKEEEEEEEENGDSEEDDEEIDDDGISCYDLVETQISKNEIPGKEYFNFKFGLIKRWKFERKFGVHLPLKIIIYSKEQDDKIMITGALMVYNKKTDDLTVLLDNPNLT